MNAGTTSERIYEHIRHLVTRRHVRPGLRLDPNAIAKDLNASSTPVREALNRLVGERLVETRDPGGFFLSTFDEPGLRDLYSWSGNVLGLVLKSGGLEAAATQFHPAGSDYPDRVGALFEAIARTSRNSEHAAEIMRLNARLHAMRQVESEVFEDIEDEFDELKSAVLSASKAIRPILLIYHRRRERSVPELVRRRAKTGSR